MKFIIQTLDGKIRGVEEFNLVKDLSTSSNKLIHEFILSDTSIHDDIEDIKDWIPVGSIQFLEEHLKRYHNVDLMTPIEVPVELRLDKFLKRKYFMLNSKDELPNEGYWFIKKCDRLKEFTSLGIPALYKDSLPEGKYAVSEVVDIVSEYRVFVSNIVIVGVQYYLGDPLVFPNVKTIKDMVDEYSKNSNRPKAYSLDIAVLESGDTVVLEVHPFASLGTYGFDGERLPRMYAWGYEYYKNTKL